MHIHHSLCVMNTNKKVAKLFLQYCIANNILSFMKIWGHTTFSILVYTCIVINLNYFIINEFSNVCPNFIHFLHWASEASPTLGCSIEISHDIIYICIYVGMSRMSN